jgi:hypothetical protein
MRQSPLLPLLCGVALGCGGEAASKKLRPDVLLVVLDSYRTE